MRPFTLLLLFPTKVVRTPVHRRHVEQVLVAIAGIADALGFLGELGGTAALFAGAAGGGVLY